MTEKHVIGIIGGMGPYGGLDFHQKILWENDAKSDQEYIPILHISYAHLINDRTKFLLHGEGDNPADGIIQVVGMLEKMGATVIGMPCNTAHSPKIFDKVRAWMAQENIKATFLHMPEVVVESIEGKRTVGLLGTTGMVNTGVYEPAFERAGMPLVLPDPQFQVCVQDAIYNLDYGLKFHNNPVDPRAVAQLQKVIEHLAENGAEIALLACTELPIAFPPGSTAKLETVDATRILARAMVRFCKENNK